MIVRQYAPCSLGRSIICLGKQGEINALRVEFDVSAWMAMYPDATVKLMHFAPDRPQDNPVIPTLGVEGTLRVWIVGEEDTSGAGNGVIELLLIDERTGSTIKSATGYTTVLRSPSAGIEAQEPEPGYVRYDVDQSALLTDTQKAFARTNIDAIKDEKDPTVPDWAKQPSKPTYTASEVGALPSSYTPPVTSVNGKTGEVALNAQDVGARPDTWTPSASDVGADAAGTASGAVAAHNVSGAAHADLRALIEGLTRRLNALADSDDTTLDQLSEIVAYIKSNKALIDAVTTGKVSVSDIVDNLTTNASGKVLSAAQGVALKAMIDGIVIPDKLPNPQPLTINGQSYDGSAAVEVSVSAGGGSTVELDTTLTQSGKAADAKVVGDKLSELNEAFNEVYGSNNLYANKSFAMFNVSNNQFVLASTLKGFYVPIDGNRGEIDISRKNIGKRFRAYTSQNEPIVNGSVSVSVSADNENKIKITPLLTDKWLYVIYRSTSLDAHIEEELLEEMKIVYSNFISIKDSVNDLVNHIVPKMEFDFSSLKQLDFEIGGINTEGLLTDNANRYRTSNTYFGKDVEILCKNENVKFSVCEYDKNGNKIGFKNLNTSSYKMNGYKYFRICVAVSNDVYFNTNRYLCDILLNAFAVKGIVFGEPQSIPLRVVTSAKPVETYSNSLKPYVCTNSHNINVTEWEVTGKLNDLYSLYDGLVNKYPHLISREVLDTVTYDGKDYEIRLYTIRGISSNNANLSEVLWISSIHGCEEGAMLNTYLMCKEILENHESNDMLSFILSNCRLMIVPTINPYGIENRSRTNGKRFIYQGVEYQGVNLNRNFDADWSFSVPDVEGEGGAKKYNDPTFDFSGLEPNSEKETQVCMDLIKLHPNACMVVNNHNGSELSIAGHSYLYSAFNVDRRLGNAMCKTLEPHIIKNNLWILDANGIDAYNKDYASVVEPSSNVGTMDKWYYSKGYHGGLVEQSLRAGSAYSENHENDLLCIGVTYNINTIAMYILKNKDIVTSHESTKKYTSVKDESINLINAD